MPIADPERALEVIDQFLYCLRHLQSPEEGWKGNLTDPYDSSDIPPDDIFDTYHKYVTTLKETVVGRQPLLEEIAKQIDPNKPPGRFERCPIDGWDRAEDAALRLRGILKFESDHQQVLGPRGPILLAEGLHPWVWNAAANLWDGQHYKQAVLEAANAVELQTRLKIDAEDRSGGDLYAHAFSIGPKASFARLRFADLDESTNTWRSAHEGAKFLGMGCSSGIRNWAAHPTNRETTEQEALEYLASLSVLARWVDTADLIE